MPKRDVLDGVISTRVDVTAMPIEAVGRLADDAIERAAQCSLANVMLASTSLRFAKAIAVQRTDVALQERSLRSLLSLLSQPPVAGGAAAGASSQRRSLDADVLAIAAVELLFTLVYTCPLVRRTTHRVLDAIVLALRQPSGLMVVWGQVVAPLDPPTSSAHLVRYYLLSVLHRLATSVGGRPNHTDTAAEGQPPTEEAFSESQEEEAEEARRLLRTAQRTVLGAEEDAQRRDAGGHVAALFIAADVPNVLLDHCIRAASLFIHRPSGGAGAWSPASPRPPVFREDVAATWLEGTSKDTVVTEGEAVATSVGMALHVLATIARHRYLTSVPLRTAIEDRLLRSPTDSVTATSGPRPHRHGGISVLAALMTSPYSEVLEGACLLVASCLNACRVPLAEASFKIEAEFQRRLLRVPDLGDKGVAVVAQHPTRIDFQCWAFTNPTLQTCVDSVATIFASLVFSSSLHGAAESSELTAPVVAVLSLVLQNVMSCINVRVRAAAAWLIRVIAETSTAASFCGRFLPPSDEEEEGARGGAPHSGHRGPLPPPVVSMIDVITRDVNEASCLWRALSIDAARSLDPSSGDGANNPPSDRMTDGHTDLTIAIVVMSIASKNASKVMIQALLREETDPTQRQARLSGMQRTLRSALARVHLSRLLSTTLVSPMQHGAPRRGSHVPIVLNALTRLMEKGRLDAAAASSSSHTASRSGSARSTGDGAASNAVIVDVGFDPIGHLLPFPSDVHHALADAGLADAIRTETQPSDRSVSNITSMGTEDVLQDYRRASLARSIMVAFIPSLFNASSESTSVPCNRKHASIIINGASAKRTGSPHRRIAHPLLEAELALVWQLSNQRQLCMDDADLAWRPTHGFNTSAVRLSGTADGRIGSRPAAIAAAPLTSQHRWAVADLRRGDMFHFSVPVTEHLPRSLSHVIVDLKAHLCDINAALQQCPLKDVSRRALLTDMLVHILPRLLACLQCLRDHHETTRSLCLARDESSISAANIRSLVSAVRGGNDLA